MADINPECKNCNRYCLCKEKNPSHNNTLVRGDALLTPVSCDHNPRQFLMPYTQQQIPVTVLS